MDIKLYRISVDKYIYQYLKPVDRKPTVVSFFNIIYSPLNDLMDAWVDYRDESIVKATVTSQHKSLQWFLNRQYDPTLKRIFTITANDDGVEAGRFDTEPLRSFEAGRFDTEVARSQETRRYGESGATQNYDFAVYIPSDISGSTNDIISTVDTYREAGISFTVIEF